MTGTPNEPDPASFEQARQLFLQGLDLFAKGDNEAAVRCFEASLAQLPGRPSTLVNLTAARLRLGRWSEALAAADQVLLQEPGSADAWMHRGDALAGLQRGQEALASHARAGELGGLGALPWYRHGQVLQSLERDSEALASYDLALAADAGFAPAWTNKGNILRERSRTEAAAQAFLRARECGGGDALNDYYLASVGAGAAPQSAPSLYVQGLFDAYADDFDHHIVDVLGYRAHQTLAQRLAAHAGERRFARALDLGCGTGLCGTLVKPMVGQLSGVDLSAGMLAKAQQSGSYELLVQDDILRFLKGLPPEERFDLVLAGDVFIYVGELAPVFAATARHLAPGALFAFSVEDAGTRGDCVLQSTLRYAHSAEHVRRLAAASGLDVLDEHQAPVRMDQRRPIAGLFFVLGRPAGG